MCGIVTERRTVKGPLNNESQATLSDPDHESVTDANQARLQAQLFSHGLEDCQIVMRIWQLTPGEYQLLCEAQGEAPHKKSITISEPGQRIPLTLPSRRRLRVALQRTP